MDIFVNKCKKEQFPANKDNKQIFKDLLSESLKQAAYSIVHSKEDADLLLFRQIIESAKSTYLVGGDDTDLLYSVTTQIWKQNSYHMHQNQRSYKKKSLGT